MTATPYTAEEIERAVLNSALPGFTHRLDPARVKATIAERDGEIGARKLELEDLLRANQRLRGLLTGIRSFLPKAPSNESLYLYRCIDKELNDA